MEKTWLWVRLKDWAKVHSFYDDKITEELPVAILLPGLTGDSRSSFLREQTLELRKEGF